MCELLFYYRTLRQREVQLATFGRELDGDVDAVTGYELNHVRIKIRRSPAAATGIRSYVEPLGRTRTWTGRLHHHRGRTGRSGRLRARRPPQDLRATAVRNAAWVYVFAG
jgi:hypothetical protein